MLAPLPAWYGKLPALGDFASRRLDPAFIELWDNWLVEGMLSLRERDPATWLDAYLISPTWRFLLMPGCLPGALGEQAWAGVLMPSVDRVGRYFPFTLVRAMTQAPVTLHALQALWQELGRLDDLAADALQDDWSAERLEAELASLAALTPNAHAAESGKSAELHSLEPGELVELTSELDGAGQIAGEALQLWGARAWGRSYWYAGAAQVPARWKVCKGLPRSCGALLSTGKATEPF
ncbi:type VI secretion system-associated protein TagF [Roseateles oligotrophus]|uniref:Type VI secretion system-associated protein TagF n=1 Tax=Roseateles oligotrophus TaxID=1769250 RepID=A0ABT2YG56_9BURK|nr:type VI secretion system-associated protein TagF [Roseateles oligotrophus]MCV2369038.1 type VI secretion system-associated protein TagF [Roseateles oligotrophus]